MCIHKPFLKKPDEPQGVNSHEYKRGHADGERGYPPQEEDGDYFDGYQEGYRKFILGCFRGNKKRTEIIRYSD